MDFIDEIPILIISKLHQSKFYKKINSRLGGLQQRKWTNISYHTNKLVFLSILKLRAIFEFEYDKFIFKIRLT